MVQDIIEYASRMDILEFAGMVFGLLCVLFLIKEHILTWICGIIYVLISFVIFWQARLYGDFLLHIFFLILNIYGWRNWVQGRQAAKSDKMPVTSLTIRSNLQVLGLSFLGILLFAAILRTAPNYLSGMPPASLPFWDSTTSVLSVTGMWLTAKKKIDNWYYWLVVDILATGIYYYKELYFYSLLYFIYIAMAVTGYLAWKRTMNVQRN